MKKILRFESSIKGIASVTRRLADSLIAGLGDSEVIRRDAQTVPLIDGDWIAAAYTAKDARSQAHVATLALSDTLIRELHEADVVVIGMPVHNFGVTGPLKSWIDQICRVGATFAYTETGPMGLLADKPVYVAYAAGGVPMGSANDFASTYLRQVLGFIGLNNVQFVAAEGVAKDEVAAIARGNEATAALAA